MMVRLRSLIRLAFCPFSATAHCVLIVLGIIALGGCTTLDLKVERTPSAALSTSESESTRLSQAWAATAPDDASLSAFRLLPNNLEAFAARVAMIDASERTLDLQYYIFRPDDTGLLLVDRMVAAADRGVRIRLLVDDLCTHGFEEKLLAFDSHPNIELRIFNPWTQRGNKVARGLEFLFKSRLNHRMHNKLFIADGIVAILGGRNLADEYFSLNPEYDFRDLDVAVAGPVLRDANRLFDEFWNGPDAIPIAGLKAKPTPDSTLVAARTQLNEHRERMKTSAYAEAVRSTEFVQQLKTKSMAWLFAPGRIVGDSAEKTTRADDPQWNRSLADETKDVFFSAKTEMLICSPYFVPGKKLTQRLCDISASGARVRILTNSQASTDVPFVYDAYAKHRKKLLRSGIDVFEIRVHGANAKEQKREFGSEVSSLHAKTFVIDEQRTYIGSLNLDPRSVVINTEIGVLVESPELAKSVGRSIAALMEPEWSYRVTLSPDGKTRWVSEDDDGSLVEFDHEPDTSWWDRFIDDLLGLLPIEKQI